MLTPLSRSTPHGNATGRFNAVSILNNNNYRQQPLKISVSLYANSNTLLNSSTLCATREELDASFVVSIWEYARRRAADQTILVTSIHSGGNLVPEFQNFVIKDVISGAVALLQYFYPSIQTCQI